MLRFEPVVREIWSPVEVASDNDVPLGTLSRSAPPLPEIVNVLSPLGSVAALKVTNAPRINSSCAISCVGTLVTVGEGVTPPSNSSTSAVLAGLRVGDQLVAICQSVGDPGVPPIQV